MVLKVHLLEKIKNYKKIRSKGEDKDKWWDQMLEQDGSAQGLPDNILTPEEKELFLTFPEINQLELVRQAAITATLYRSNTIFKFII